MMVFMVMDTFNIDRELVSEFFATFSRFEYALKRSSFCREQKNKGVEADWDRFENELAKLDAIELNTAS